MPVGSQPDQSLSPTKAVKSATRKVAFRGETSNPERVEFSVYDGRRPLGEVVETPGCGCHAATADGRDLGHFPNRAAASHAVIAAARAR